MKKLFAIGSSFVLAACGGGGSSSGPNIRIVLSATDTGGVYDVDVTTVTGFHADAILAITEDGKFIVSENPTLPLDGLYMRGDIDVRGDTLTGVGVQIAVPGFPNFTLDDGQVSRQLTIRLQGTVNIERQDIEGTFTVDGITGTGDFHATSTNEQIALYNIDSSFADVAGTYQDIRTGTLLTVTINDSGVITGDASCGISGQLGLIDENFNMYDLDVTVSNCPGFVEGTYQGYVSLDEDSGNPLLVTAGDDDAEALFVYLMDKI